MDKAYKTGRIIEGPAFFLKISSVDFLGKRKISAPSIANNGYA
jgi:hypothetical protein